MVRTRTADRACNENDEGAPTTRAQGGGNLTQHPPPPSLSTPCLMDPPSLQAFKAVEGHGLLGCCQRPYREERVALETELVRHPWTAAMLVLDCWELVHRDMQRARPPSAEPTRYHHSTSYTAMAGFGTWLEQEES